LWYDINGNIEFMSVDRVGMRRPVPPEALHIARATAAFEDVPSRVDQGLRTRVRALDALDRGNTLVAPQPLTDLDRLATEGDAEVLRPVTELPHTRIKTSPARAERVHRDSVPQIVTPEAIRAAARPEKRAKLLSRAEVQMEHAHRRRKPETTPAEERERTPHKIGKGLGTLRKAAVENQIGEMWRLREAEEATARAEMLRQLAESMASATKTDEHHIGKKRHSSAVARPSGRKDNIVLEEAAFSDAETESAGGVQDDVDAPLDPEIAAELQQEGCFECGEEEVAPVDRLGELRRSYVLYDSAGEDPLTILREQSLRAAGADVILGDELVDAVEGKGISVSLDALRDAELAAEEEELSDYALTRIDQS
jgi:hypothetical protein